MNAPPEAQLRLLDLQAADAALDRLAHRRRTLPEHAELETLDARLAVLREESGRASLALDDMTRELARAEADVELVRARRARDQARLDTGAVGNPRELENLSSEVVSLTRRQSDLEDVELEVMERREAGEVLLAALRSEQETRAADRAAVVARRDTAYDEIDRETEALGARRVELAEGLPGDLVALYERIRAAEGGVGAAELARGRCSGCRLEVSGQDLRELRAAPPDAVVRHEECGRILVRTAESGL